MSVVFLTAIGVGGATVIGALIGFLFRGLSHKFSNLIVSFAAGIMLSAAVLGLILPSIEYGGDWGVAVAVLGILVGGVCINLSDRLVPHIQKIVAPHPSAAPPPSPEGEGLRGERPLISRSATAYTEGEALGGERPLISRSATAYTEGEALGGESPLISRSATASPEGEALRKNTARSVLLFVIAIGIHNLPEGIAAGVGFGAGDIENAILIAAGIALHNIPEGMVIITPMLSAGISPGRTFVMALITGLAEVVGTLIGYFAVSLASAILPFALAFAGGAMLYVISEEMIPESHSSGKACRVTYAFLCGFCCMLVLDAVM